MNKQISLKTVVLSREEWKSKELWDVILSHFAGRMTYVSSDSLGRGLETEVKRDIILKLKEEGKNNKEIALVSGITVRRVQQILCSAEDKKKAEKSGKTPQPKDIKPY